ncbi:MAG: dicarboxylate/amino acid:cation symporter [Campylobacter sp.]|nr:dicarboxylate/amino acid:cation symporter [Campylobacter sp.]
MSFFKSLPFKLLLGIVVGAFIGVWCIKNAGFGVADDTMQIIVCAHRLMGQFVSFCVPLIVLGFICPSITKMWQNAGKLLGIALVIAYLSSILAASMSAFAAFQIVPNLQIANISNQAKLPEAIFKLDIPQIMPVMTALVLSIVIGLAAIWTKATRTIELLAEFQNIVLSIVKKIVIPILPFYIGTTFATLGYNGTISQFSVFLIAIVVVILGHFIWLGVLYGVAGIYSGKNPLEVLKHYGPAYLTAVGTMSSAATLPVALECARKSTVLRKDLIGFGIPLFANIHLCGSVLTEMFFIFIVSGMVFGAYPSIATLAVFILLFGIFAVGAPGVPGGTVVASLGIVESIICVYFGATPEQTATFVGMLLAIFALQDSFGTACNVTGDGALTLFLTGYCEKHKIAEA